MKKKFLTFTLTICAILACIFGFSACGEQHEHAYTVQISKEATCIEKGLIRYTCSCGSSYTQEILALGHDKETHQAQAPTCTEVGWEEYVTCEREGCEYSTYQEIPATGVHTWDKGEETKAPTCTEQGETTYTCTVCKTATKTEPINKLPHEYAEQWTSNATYHWHECSCGDKKDEEKHVEGAPATATTPQICTVCEYILQNQITLTLKELRLNAEYYNGQKVAFEGVMTAIYDGGAYVESYDEETGIWFGMYVYYGFFASPTLLEYFQPGYKFRIVGTLSYWEVGDSWQVSDIEFNPRNPQAPGSTCIVDEENIYPPANIETTLERFNEKIEIEVKDPKTGEITKKEYTYSELAVGSTIKMNNLRVVSAYTINNGGDNDGAISITCEYGGRQIVIRTEVLFDENYNQVKASAFTDKTIDVVGFVEKSGGSYRIKVLEFVDITIH
jgi:hypothetical protein